MEVDHESCVSQDTSNMEVAHAPSGLEVTSVPPNLEVASAPSHSEVASVPSNREAVPAASLSSVEEDQLLGFASPARMSTLSGNEDSHSAGEDPDLAGATNRHNRLEGPLRLSGAARKRFKRLKAQGVPYAQARELALKPQQTPQSGKRPRSEGSTPPDTVKRTKTSPPARFSKGAEMNFREAVSGIRVGVMAADFPNVHLTNDQLTSVRSAMLDRVFDNTDGTVQPSYHGCTFRPGYIIFSCKDESTAVWTRRVGGELTPWEGAKLMTVEDKDLPRTQVATAFFPFSSEDSNERILGFLKKQNADLQVDRWRVFSRVVDGDGVHLALSVDCGTAQQLKAVPNFQANYKFGNVQLRLKGAKVEAKAKAPSAVDSASMMPPAPVSAPALDRPSTSQEGATQVAGSGSSGKMFLPQGPKGPSTSFRGSRRGRGSSNTPLRGRGSSDTPHRGRDNMGPASRRGPKKWRKLPHEER